MSQIPTTFAASTQAVLECVPNFSEGSNPKVLDAIAQAIRGVAEVRLLEVDAGGRGTNRTVMSFAGPPEAVVEAAFRAIAEAAQRIDMRHHRGEHPRMGATDVCPLIPISGLSLAEAAALARGLGERVGRELGIPVYLYEAAASAPHRRSLAAIRAGEYEGYFDKIHQPYWRPDFGPTEFNALTGGTVIGARNVLVAYNINLDTPSLDIARSIAAEVRSSGRVVRQPDGSQQRVPGLLTNLRAMGWYLPDYQLAQVSMNLLDVDATPIHTVFEAVAASAQRHGCSTAGSELIGLVPLRAILVAGRHFAESTHVHITTEEGLISLAIRGLGLDSLRPFDPTHKVLEYALANAAPSI
jgi:glutamate formiminotransferase